MKGFTLILSTALLLGLYSLGFGESTTSPHNSQVWIQYIDASTDSYEQYISKLSKSAGSNNPLSAELASEDMYRLLNAPIGFSLLANQNYSAYASDPSALPTELQPEPNAEISFSTPLEQILIYQDLQDKKMLARLFSKTRKQLVHLNTDLPTIEWNLLSDRKVLAGYPCQLARGIMCQDTLLAYFTTAMPILVGPACFQGLPGAILEVSYQNGARRISATRIHLGQADIKSMGKAFQASYTDPPGVLGSLPYAPAAFCQAL